MKSDALKQFTALRQSLHQEKKHLEARLEQINRVLRSDEGSGSPVQPGARRGGVRRVANPMSLRAAVLQVTRDKPLSKQDILIGIKKLGYRFTAKDPINSLNTVLYTGRTFKNTDGRFGPARG